MKRDPEKDRAWRERSAKRYADKQRETGRKPLPKVGQRKARTVGAERDFRAALVARAGGMCEVATPACPPHRHAGHHAHHRLMRSQGGGHEPSNGLWVCSPAHGYIHANPAESYDAGWLLRGVA